MVVGGEHMTPDVSIRPGVGMLGLFQHMKYRPWYALGELVDNSLQSYLSNRDRLRDIEGPDYRLKVDIELSKDDGGSIIIRDNAAGISLADWPRAFLVAEPPSDASGLSQFGIGMKAACCWFADEWSLRTTHLGEDVSRSVTFNVPQIISSRDDTLAAYEEPMDWRQHFTELRLWNLHRIPQTRTIGKMRNYLGAIYRQFLRNDDILLTFNGEAVDYVEPPVLWAPRWDAPAGSDPVEWRKDVDIRLESGRRVTGFVAIRETGSTTDAGLALFYRRKVVTGAGDESYRPPDVFGQGNTFASQRVFGELNMDDFNVTYTKDAIVWYDEEEEFLDLLREHLNEGDLPLLRQAGKYRSRVASLPKEHHAQDVVDRTSQLLEQAPDLSDDEPLLPEDITWQEPLVPEPEPEPAAAARSVFAGRQTEVLVSGTTWTVHLELVNDLAMSDWVSSVKDPESSANKVTVTVNQAHPFMRAFCEAPDQELEPVWRVAIALGLGQEIARQSGVAKAGVVTKKVNLLLRSVLSKQVP